MWAPNHFIWWQKLLNKIELVQAGQNFILLHESKSIPLTITKPNIYSQTFVADGDESIVIKIEGGEGELVVMDLIVMKLEREQMI